MSQEELDRLAAEKRKLNEARERACCNCRWSGTRHIEIGVVYQCQRHSPPWPMVAPENFCGDYEERA